MKPIEISYENGMEKSVMYMLAEFIRQNCDLAENRIAPTVVEILLLKNYEAKKVTISFSGTGIKPYYIVNFGKVGTKETIDVMANEKLVKCLSDEHEGDKVAALVKLLEKRNSRLLPNSFSFFQTGVSCFSGFNGRVEMFRLENTEGGIYKLTIFKAGKSEEHTIKTVEEADRLLLEWEKTA